MAEFDQGYEEHETCWDIRQRGEVGETILHLCYLNNTEVHTTIAEHLLGLYPKLCLDIYEGFEYYGRLRVGRDISFLFWMGRGGARKNEGGREGVNNIEIQTAIIEYLLSLYPKLCLDIYEGFEYYGRLRVGWGVSSFPWGEVEGKRGRKGEEVNNTEIQTAIIEYTSWVFYPSSS